MLVSNHDSEKMGIRTADVMITLEGVCLRRYFPCLVVDQVYFGLAMKRIVLKHYAHWQYEGKPRNDHISLIGYAYDFRYCDSMFSAGDIICCLSIIIAHNAVNSHI
jgi:hypothetical protein